MDDADRAAVLIMNRLSRELVDGAVPPRGEGESRGAHLLIRAVRHLAYPDRDVYPKTRRGTKSNPVTLNA